MIKTFNYLSESYGKGLLGRREVKWCRKHANYHPRELCRFSFTSRMAHTAPFRLTERTHAHVHIGVPTQAHTNGKWFQYTLTTRHPKGKKKSLHYNVQSMIRSGSK